MTGPDERLPLGDGEWGLWRDVYPGPGDLWLPDAEGLRYTSELRLTIADTTGPEAIER